MIKKSVDVRIYEEFKCARIYKVFTIYKTESKVNI